MSVPAPKLPASRRTARALALLLAAAMLLMGCGDGGGNRGRRRPPGPPPKPKPEPDPVLETFELLGENPQFVPIKDMFARYEAAKIEELANPLQSNLVTFVEKPIIERKAQDPSEGAAATIRTGEVEKVKIDTSDPRREWPLEKYKLIIIMTGTARPKAVVLSPGDKRFELRRGDPIGKEGGRVRAITQFAMMVALPGQTELLKISLRPPLAKLDIDPPKKKDDKGDF